MAVIKRTYLTAAILMLAIAAQAQQKNFVMRTIDWGYKIVQGDSAHPRKKYFFVVPILSYKPETRWQAGVSFSHFFRVQHTDSLTRPSVARLNFSYTQNKQFSVRPMFDIFTAGNRYNYRGILQYSDFIENYWGIGNTVGETSKELYSFKQYKANVKATKLILPGVYGGIQANFENLFDVKHNPSSLAPSSRVKGINGYTCLGFGPVISFDNRDHIYFPKRGHFIDIAAAFYAPALGNFTSLNIDARKYVALWNDNVLAFQLYGNFNTSGVPYRLMGTLGNESYFRGYYFGRYRDAHALAFQAEFRKHVWGPAGIVIFGGAGNVSNSLSSLNQHLKPMYGAGLRIKAIPREKINIRFDYAMGHNGIKAFYITLNEAF